jgi:hypothetical protein
LYCHRSETLEAEVNPPDESQAAATRVLEETIRFRDALPELLKTHRGEWVVFKDGEARSFHATEEEAYQEGIRQFGHQGGHVVALVAEQTPTPLTAGVLFHVA